MAERMLLLTCTKGSLLLMRERPEQNIIRILIGFCVVAGLLAVAIQACFW